MKLCLTGWSFPLCTVEETAGIALALGFDAVDFGAFPGGQLSRDAILGDQGPEIRRLKSCGIKTSNIYWTFGAGFGERAVNNPDPQVRACNREDWKRIVEFCHAAAVPSVMILPGVLHPGQTREDAFLASVEGIRELMPVADAAGVTVALEPHVMSILEAPAEVLRLLKEVPGLRLALDYSHFATLGYTQAEVDPLAAYTAHFHCRQAKPGFLQMRLEWGTLNFPLILDTLRRAGYDGYLAIEYVHQEYLQTDNVDVISETVKMRDLLLRYM